MDEATFRSGRNPDGTPIAHGIDPEMERIREQRDDLRRELNTVLGNLDRTRVSYGATIRLLDTRIEALEANAKMHDWRVTGLLEANNDLLERARVAERKLRENGL